ncbi:MAG: DEAD/DEAH box helicase [Gammaproteobacteria bacterium]|nr:DEAD/DEAH box helicase [Gammaproteobacteria bacterium]
MRVLISPVGWTPKSSGSPGPGIGDGRAADIDPDTVVHTPPSQEDLPEQLPGAIMARIVEKCGSRKYWDEWAGDVARIARAHIERITAMVTVDETNRDNPDIQAAAEMFDGFVKELQDDLNSGITRENAIEMLAQHMVTGPVFDALFETEAFTKRNPVSQAMQNMLDVIKPSGIDAEAENLEEFYASVKHRAKGASSDEAKQQIIAELYDKFFRNAFAETSKKLGIVYTPVAAVDFILQSTEQVLNNELGASMSDQGVNILDPFTGTGTFITRLFQSGLIKDADIERKFDHEIHANEIVLLAYYIAAVNIESVFHAKSVREYRPFKHICLTDTFQMGEEAAQTSLVKDSLKENSDRRSGQRDLDIRVIVGNPPWMAGKKEPGYPELYKQIEETYAKESTATLKNSLYDTYKLAIRWASDRIGDRGVIGFVTNGSWIQGNVDSGIRACLAKEFSSVYVVDLRGNARTSGELRKTEGDNIFDLGSRAPVAIMILVKNPLASHEGCRILYRDIGDYLSQENKLKQLVEWQSITGIDDWQEVRPDSNFDWINKRESRFNELFPLGSKKAKSGKAYDTVFRLFSNGFKTSRDAYLYNFSLDSCAENARLMIDDYKSALEKLGDNPTANEAELASKQHEKNTHWDRELINNLARKKKVNFSSDRIWKIQYRPFVKQHCYVDYTLVNNKYQQNLIFPETDTENRTICLPGVGSSQPFSALMTDHMPDLGINSATQCFPRYRFEKSDEQKQDSLFEIERGGERIDNITDNALDKFQSHYQDRNITKDDIFDYVYGVLHAPDFREAFPNALSKELTRIPFAPDFRVFAKAGHDLGDLHVGYEHCPEYSLELEFSGNGNAEPRHFKLGTKAMRYEKNEEGSDKSSLIVNEYIRLTGIPDEAHEYMVNGRTPLDWLIDRYKITPDKKSGKVNDPNAWFENPEDLISTIRRIVYLSVETIRIVRSLPNSIH